MQPGWCQPVRQEFTENECEALPGVAYPGVRDNRSTLNTKTEYDDDDDTTGRPTRQLTINRNPSSSSLYTIHVVYSVSECCRYIAKFRKTQFMCKLKLNVLYPISFEIMFLCKFTLFKLVIVGIPIVQCGAIDGDF